MMSELQYIDFEYRLYFYIIKIEEFEVFIHFQRPSSACTNSIFLSIKNFQSLIWPIHSPFFSSYIPGSWDGAMAKKEKATLENSHIELLKGSFKVQNLLNFEHRRHIPRFKIVLDLDSFMLLKQHVGNPFTESNTLHVGA